ncbi:hypothetical protein BUALT_Bualt10G0073000 [Buddleja alternifolia]|uniref:F-box associated beta-propeller type 1 domain-containing protein n=1 Tax=Buddleja alternifolia TaxID=168488 RepID=A0AAV6X7L9_9LAMI|nr:hypothetical protein BUALT_Bualt10G0073000 [Buddleja alternifolia]
MDLLVVLVDIMDMITHPVQVVLDIEHMTMDLRIMQVLNVVSNSLSAPELREGEILTIGVDDRWRGLDRVANPTIPYPFARTNLVIVNEAFHWFVIDIGPTCISTFDFGEEKMGRLSHPHGLELNFACTQLISTNNQLCLLDGSNPCEIVPWKMKEYGLQSLTPKIWELTAIEVPCLEIESIDYSPCFLSLNKLMTGGHSSTIKLMRGHWNTEYPNLHISIPQFKQAPYILTMKKRGSGRKIQHKTAAQGTEIGRNGTEVIYVSNPIMGEYVELPEHERDHDDTRFVVYKIGFSPSANNFKVLRIVYKTWLDTNVEECKIFTVGVDDRWKRLDNPFTNLCYWVDGISFNGAFHWILQDKGSFQISTLDLAEERAGQVLHPPGLVLDSKTMNLALFDNQLSLVDYSVESQITIWTMKEYRNAVLDQRCDMRSWFPPGLHISKLSPVGQLQNGDIIFGHSADLISFNVEQKKCSRIGFFGIPRVASRVIPYAPSFKSLSEAI